MKKQSFVLALLLVILNIFGCFPNFQASSVRKDEVADTTKIQSPTKAYALDASVILLPRGFVVRNDSIIGLGQRFWLNKSDPVYRMRAIPLDSIAAMTHYDSRMTGGRGIATFLLGTLSAVMAPLSIYCISCPKCCFGSCPTVYISSEHDTTLQAELFSHSISKRLEGTDLDVLSHQLSHDDTLHLRLTNEALETHFINRFSLLAVQHPAGTKVFPSDRNDVLLVRSFQAPLGAVTRSGNDIRDLLLDPDNRPYRSGRETFASLAQRGEWDWIDVNVDVPEGTRKVIMVLRLKNTLLSTVLFYDVVLGSQGLLALDWNKRLDDDDAYAAKFQKVYETFSGVTVQVATDGAWITHSTIRDAGPIAWKSVATDIPVLQPGRLTIRLEFFPDNIMVDFIAFDFQTSDEVSFDVQEIQPLAIHDNVGTPREDIRQLLREDDDQYLITHPGDLYRFTYHVPGGEENDVSLLVSSRGYYTEWIRGDWLRVRQRGYRFDLSDTRGTISQLVRSWLENKDLIEQRFSESRIPVREVQ